MMRTVLTLLALTLIGCESAVDRQHKDAMRRLDAVDPAKLVIEAASILALPKEKRTFDLARGLWTPEIVKLAPVTVRCYDDGIAILIEKWSSKESGFYVTPGGSHHPDSDAQAGVRRKITSEIDWYAL